MENMTIAKNLFMNSSVKFKVGHCYSVVTWKNGLEVVRISKLDTAVREDGSQTFVLVAEELVKSLDQFDFRGIPDGVTITPFKSKKEENWYSVRLAPKKQAEETEGEELPFEVDSAGDIVVEETPVTEKKTQVKKKKKSSSCPI